MIATLSQQDIEYTDAKSLKNTIKVSGNAFSMECCAVAHIAVRAADGTEQQIVVSFGIYLYKIASPLKCLFLSDLFADLLLRPPILLELLPYHADSLRNLLHIVNSGLHLLTRWGR